MSVSQRFDPCTPGDVDVLEFDLSQNLPDGTTATAATFTVSPSGMTIISSTVVASVAMVWFSPIAGNRDYAVSCTFQTSDGRTRTRSAMIFCTAR